MSTFYKVFHGIADILNMDDKIKFLSQELKDMSIYVHAIDRRVIRLETMVELGGVRRNLIQQDEIIS